MFMVDADQCMPLFYSPYLPCHLKGSGEGVVVLSISLSVLSNHAYQWVRVCPDVTLDLFICVSVCPGGTSAYSG